jgi:hypothetical protein
VGGFARSPFLQARIRHGLELSCGSTTPPVVVPPVPHAAVLNGMCHCTVIECRYPLSLQLVVFEMAWTFRPQNLCALVVNGKLVGLILRLFSSHIPHPVHAHFQVLLCMAVTPPSSGPDAPRTPMVCAPAGPMWRGHPQGGGTRRRGASTRTPSSIPLSRVMRR